MGYSRIEDVEWYSRITDSYFSGRGFSDYNSSVNRAIASADALIDEYCYPPSDGGTYLHGFFEPGGIEVAAEHLNGVDVVWTFEHIRFPGWMRGGESHLRFNYRPVLSVTSLEEETGAGVWTARTEGSGSDFIVVADGVRFVESTPEYRYKNVRVTYKAGYRFTPRVVSEVSARLAATIIHQILDAANRSTAAMGNVTSTPPPNIRSDRPVLTDEFKRMLNPYRMVDYAVC